MLNDKHTDTTNSLSDISAPTDLERSYAALISTLNVIANKNDPDNTRREQNSLFQQAFLRLLSVANGESAPINEHEAVFSENGPIKGCVDLAKFETKDFLGVWGRNYNFFDRLEAVLRYGSPRTRLKDHDSLSKLLFELHMEGISKK